MGAAIGVAVYFFTQDAPMNPIKKGAPLAIPTAAIAGIGASNFFRRAF